MTYLKISQIIYLFFAAFFTYHAFSQYRAGEDFWWSIIIAAVALGMFFFRRRMLNKYDKQK